MDFREYIEDNFLLIDGAMGTQLYKEGLDIKEMSSDVFGYIYPEKLMKVHKDYLIAGSKVITTNTFLSNKLNLNRYGYSPEIIIENAVKVAKKSIDELGIRGDRYVALDIGPIGIGINNDEAFKSAYNMFKSQVIQGVKSGVDLIIIETMIDLEEARAAVLAAKENSNLPVFCTMTFKEDGRGLSGCTPNDFVQSIQKLGVDAIGANCSLGPKQLESVVCEFVKYSNVPVIVQANAGIPRIVNGEDIYNIDANEFYKGIEKFIELGATIIGGCCGTDPSFIKKINDNIKNLSKLKL